MRPCGPPTDEVIPLNNGSMFSWAGRRLLLVSLVSSLCACVTADPQQPNIKDQDPDTTSMDMTMDMVVEDTPPDLPPDQPEMPIDMCDVCCPGDKMCMPSGAVGTCKEDGSGYDEVMCSDTQECMNAQCVDKKVCEPGSATCFDSQTRQVCRPGGTAFRTESCTNGDSCINGQCVSGSPNGEMCAAHGDCGGSKCHCGTGTQEGCSATTFDRAYCTSPCSNSAECSGNELCFASDVHTITSQVANYNHCVTKCQGTCTLPGMACKKAPVLDGQGELTWAEVCYFPKIKQIGEECTRDEECIGGVCLKDYFNTGYCSRRCETGGCPDNAACVQLKGNEFWCSAKCGDGSTGSTAPCPLDTPVDRFDVTCKTSQIFGGGAARVCSKT